jgi:hypothetical protein
MPQRYFWMKTIPELLVHQLLPDSTKAINLTVTRVDPHLRQRLFQLQSHVYASKYMNEHMVETKKRKIDEFGTLMNIQHFFLPYLFHAPTSHYIILAERG